MRYLAMLAVAAALSLLYVLLRAAFAPSSLGGGVPSVVPTERVQAVRRHPSAGTARPPVPKPSHKPPSHGTGDTAPCDRLFDADEGPLLRLPPGTVVKRGSRRCADGPCWTWINAWAVWCKPCRKEMPLLSRLDKGIVPVFLSVDDDERQLRRYLDRHGDGILGDVLWVQDPVARKRFFGTLGLPEQPILPVHAVYDPKGRLRCLRVGSLDTSDLEAMKRSFGFGGHR